MAKTYCFVDESINAHIGVMAIAVVTTRSVLDDLYSVCEDIEQSSGKGRTKWGKAKWDARVRYFERIETDARFHNALFYSRRNDSPSIHIATIHAIAMAIERVHDAYNDKQNHITVLVDALSKQKRHEYRSALTQRGLRINKVRGVTSDENNSLIRLADSLAGLVNDAASGKNEDAKRLLDRIERSGVAIQL